MPRPPPVRRGGWPCGWITAPSICRTTSPTRSSSGASQPSYAFVEQPQTNGVAERFNRTLKEQIIHGRIYRNIAELRNAVRGFVEQYNAQWIVEKNGYLSPRSSSSGVAHRDVTQARRMRQTCVPRNRVRYHSLAATRVEAHSAKPARVYRLRKRITGGITGGYGFCTGLVSR